MLQHTYIDILYNRVLLPLWQQFREELHMGVMARCAQTFRHIVYIKNIQLNVMCITLPIGWILFLLILILVSQYEVV